ncbi:MAG: hypothetical protein H0V37_11510 [Chloroflexia bacterium]|nr:hypothetical protein [Chloroflexia bacterium]
MDTSLVSMGPMTQLVAARGPGSMSSSIRADYPGEVSAAYQTQVISDGASGRVAPATSIALNCP